MKLSIHNLLCCRYCLRCIVYIQPILTPKASSVSVWSDATSATETVQTNQNKETWHQQQPRLWHTVDYWMVRFFFVSFWFMTVNSTHSFGKLLKWKKQKVCACVCDAFVQNNHLEIMLIWNDQTKSNPFLKKILFTNLLRPPINMYQKKEQRIFLNNFFYLTFTLNVCEV